MRDAFLAIDVGTQSSRAAVLTLDGQVLAVASQPHAMATPRPGWAEQNPADWWDATLRNVREVVSETDGPGAGRRGGGLRTDAWCRPGGAGWDGPDNRGPALV